MSEELKEFIVTTKEYSALDSLYEKMESNGGTDTIPNRKVDVVHRREISRNTHYLLTETEAEKLSKDPDILSVTPKRDPSIVKIRPLWIQTSSNWDHSSCWDSNGSAQSRNWGLVDASQSSSERVIWNGLRTDTISNSSEGRNVDVVISDGMVNPNHPEFAVNEDGTGGSRVVQYNWLQHRSVVQGIANGTYVYTPYIDSTNAGRTSDNTHGNHVAGTVAGNRQGWARRANIYNINPYSTDINGIDDAFHFDYIRQFHRNKPINPNTGRRNPTIVNASWGYGATIRRSLINRIIYNGTTFNGPFTSWDEFAFRDVNGQGYFDANNVFQVGFLWREAPIDTDIHDAINDGIIIIGAAGNETSHMDIDGGASWDNRVIFNNSSETLFINRGSTPGSASTVISVGSHDGDLKSYFSNYGPRINIWSPGNDIMSPVLEGGCSWADSRNSSHKIGKLSGTSMASPQVCGILACTLERYPHLNQTSILKYINEKLSQPEAVYDSPTEYYYKLDGAPNIRIYNFQHKKNNGAVTPVTNYGLRSDVSAKYPRLNKRKRV